jgi:hypothetical protein
MHPDGVQLGNTVPQPTELPIQVGSSQTASGGSVPGPLPETSLQGLDLRVKNAPEGKVGDGHGDVGAGMDRGVGHELAGHQGSKGNQRAQNPSPAGCE